MSKRQDNSTVALCHAANYQRTALLSLFDQIFSQYTFQTTLRGAVVLLKPNLISLTAPPLGCTNKEFVAAAAEWFLAQGARVKLGDSPAFGSVTGICRKQGIAEALQGQKVEFVDFKTPRLTELSCNVSLSIAEEACECDLFVGLPKIKAHNQMFVTLSVKNLFGLVVGLRKGMLHMTEGGSHDRFAEIILELVSLLPEQFHLVDGVEAMHRSGPINGEKLPLGLIGGATDPVALDTALLTALELEKQSSPLWRVAHEQKRRGCNQSQLVYPLLTPQYFFGSGFIPPENLNPVRFNPFRYITGIVRRVMLVSRS
jgi:uncharacterized protein (DUF362 family)